MLNSLGSRLGAELVLSCSDSYPPWAELARIRAGLAAKPIHFGLSSPVFCSESYCELAHLLLADGIRAGFAVIAIRLVMMVEQSLAVKAIKSSSDRHSSIKTAAVNITEDTLSQSTS